MLTLPSKTHTRYRNTSYSKPKRYGTDQYANVALCRLKADKELVKEVYSAAKRLKMDRVKQVGPALCTIYCTYSVVSHIPI